MYLLIYWEKVDMYIGILNCPRHDFGTHPRADIVAIPVVLAEDAIVKPKAQAVLEQQPVEGQS